jgi:hypothetical protein
MIKIVVPNVYNLNCCVLNHTVTKKYNNKCFMKKKKGENSVDPVLQFQCNHGRHCIIIESICFKITFSKMGKGKIRLIKEGGYY